jgi:signal transduction histidine kinase
MSRCLALVPGLRLLRWWGAASLLAVLLSAADSTPLGELEKKAASASAAEKSAVLVQLSREVEPLDATRALDYARRALAAAQSPADKLEAEVQLAAMLRLRGDYSEAMSLARAGLAAAAADDHLRARFLYVIARTHWSLGNPPAALAAFLEAITLAEKTDDRALLCDAHTGVSSLYFEAREVDRMREHITKAIQLAETLQDPVRLGDAYKVYGNLLIRQGDLAGARTAHERSLQIHQQAGNERGVADAWQNLASLAESDHDLAAAVNNCTRAVAIYQRLGLKRHLLNAERELGRVLVKQGRTREGIAHLNTSLSLAQEIGAGRTALANAYHELALAHEATGDLRAALDAQRREQTENDALFTEKTRQQLATLNAAYDAERRQHEIDLLRRDQALQAVELERARWTRYGLASALIVGVAALGAVINRQRFKLRTEQRILAETTAAKEAAEDADRVKTRFLAVASHDIRAPLGNIVSLSAHLRDLATPSGPQHDLVDTITAEAQRVLNLVEDLISTAALEEGKLELRPAPLDLVDLVRRVVGTVGWQAEAKRQSIQFHLPEPGAGTIIGDAARLHQVFANLLGNAIKFTPPGKAITVSLTRTDGRVTLAVRDQGPGIAEKDFGQLFVPFQRLASHPTAGTSSHGLGLSIAHEIVRLHGGKIRVESTPGEGATFFVELPTGAGA